MKMRSLLLVIFAAVLINPRVNSSGGLDRTNYLVSCSTGWTLHFGKTLGGKSLYGAYSLDSASHILSRDSSGLGYMKRSTNSERVKSYQSARDSILEVCK